MDDAEVLKLAKRVFSGPSAYRRCYPCDDKRVHPDLMRDFEDIARHYLATYDIVAKPLNDWHEDDGFVLWVRFPIDEPPYVGHPDCCNWPGYHTHWIPLPDASRIIPGESAHEWASS